MLKNEETANTWISLKGLIQLKIAKFPIHTDTQIRKFTSQNSQIHTSHRQTNSQIHNLKQTNSQIHNLNRPNSHFTHTFQFTNSQHNLAKFTNSQLKMGQFTIHKKVFTPRLIYRIPPFPFSSLFPSLMVLGEEQDYETGMDPKRKLDRCNESHF